MVPLPRNGSKTTSPGSENAFTKNSTSARGNGAECDPWLLSVFTSITLLGRAMPVVPAIAIAGTGPSLPRHPRAPVPRSPLPEFDFGLSGE